MKNKSMMFDFNTIVLFAREITSRMNFLGYDTTFTVSMGEFGGPTVKGAMNGNMETEGFYIAEAGMFHNIYKGFKVNFTISVPKEGEYVYHWVKADINKVCVRDGLETWDTLYSVEAAEVYGEQFMETVDFYSMVPSMKDAFEFTMKNVKADMDGLIQLCQKDPRNLKKIEDPECCVEEFNNLLIEMVKSLNP